MKIELITAENDLAKRGVEYFWKCWGNESNFDFYEDCIRHSFSDELPLPKFYLLLHQGEIIGSYALLRNDIISRQDLTPWLACLFVNEPHRNKGLAGELLVHGLCEARVRGFDQLYLSTDLDNFYEKRGWTFHSKGFGVGGDVFKIYAKSTATQSQ